MAISPGPWEWGLAWPHDLANERCDMGAVYDAAGGQVCDFGMAQDVDGWGHGPNEDDKAAILAVPDLLAACKYALSQLESAGIVCGDVRAALRKAEPKGGW